MVDLGMRGPGDDLLQFGRLLGGEGLQIHRGDGALLHALIHEGEVGDQNGAGRGPPICGHVRLVERVDRGLHPGAIRQQGGAPILVPRVVQVRRHHLGQRHGAVADRFHELVGHRHRRRVERRLTRAIQDEAPTCAGEQAENDGVVGPDVALEHLSGGAIEVEHRSVQCQHVLHGQVTRRGGDGACDRGHERRGLGERGCSGEAEAETSGEPDRGHGRLPPFWFK